MEVWKKNLYICLLGGFASSAALSEIAPILPLYINYLGVHDLQQVETLTGFAFGCTTMVAAFFAPFWGNMADRYGRRAMMLRSSIGMAVVLAATGYAYNVTQLVILRLLMGFASGFNVTAVTLVATQAPSEKSGWALGTLNTGIIGGMLLGPIIGGYLIEVTTFRALFLIMGFFIAIAFFLTLFFVKEDFHPPQKKLEPLKQLWREYRHKKVLVMMVLTSFVTQAALFAIEPIITIYVHILAPNTQHLAFISGIIFASAGFSSLLTAPYLGHISDRIGPHRVVFYGLLLAGIFYIPQAFVHTEWQLMAFRLISGVAFGALYPAINAVLKRFTPDRVAGRIFSYIQTGQFFGIFIGSFAGGQISALFGIPKMFLLTSVFLFLNAAAIYYFIYLPIQKGACRPE